MNKNIFNKINNLNNIDTKNLLSLEKKIKNFKDINNTYLEIKDYFKNYYDVETLDITICDKSRRKHRLSLRSHRKNTSRYKVVFNYVLNDDVEIIFNVSLDNSLSKNEADEISYKLDFISSALINYIYTIYLRDTILSLKLIDQTTGLYNRKYLIQHLEKMLPLAQRENHIVAFLIVGIDHFKAVIDEFNYDIGDKVIVKLGDLLLKNVRTSDIIVKLEADEFLIVLPNVQDIDNAQNVAKKLVNKFSKLEFEINDKNDAILKKTICVGISLFPNDSISVDEILRNADISLYEARNTGRSKVLKFTDKLTSSIELF